MGSNYEHENEMYQQDYNKMFAKGSWTKDEIEMMKNLKKLIYYNTVLCEMEKGKDRREAWENEYGGSGANGNQMRNANGQFTSGNGMGTYPGNVGSGMYYPPYYYDNGLGSWNDGGRYYDGMTSGRRYYDNEREDAKQKFRHMMETTNDPELKSAAKMALSVLEPR